MTGVLLHKQPRQSSYMHLYVTTHKAGLLVSSWEQPYHPWAPLTRWMCWQGAGMSLLRGMTGGQHGGKTLSDVTARRIAPSKFGRARAQSGNSGS